MISNKGDGATGQLGNWQLGSLKTWQLTARTRSFDATVKYVSLQLRLDESTVRRINSHQLNTTRRLIG